MKLHHRTRGHHPLRDFYPSRGPAAVRGDSTVREVPAQLRSQLGSSLQYGQHKQHDEQTQRVQEDQRTYGSPRTSVPSVAWESPEMAHARGILRALCWRKSMGLVPQQGSAPSLSAHTLSTAKEQNAAAQSSPVLPSTSAAPIGTVFDVALSPMDATVAAGSAPMESATTPATPAPTPVGLGMDIFTVPFQQRSTKARIDEEARCADLSAMPQPSGEQETLMTSAEEDVAYSAAAQLQPDISSLPTQHRSIQVRMNTEERPINTPEAPQPSGEHEALSIIAEEDIVHTAAMMNLVSFALAQTPKDPLDTPGKVVSLPF